MREKFTSWFWKVWKDAVASKLIAEIIKWGFPIYGSTIIGWIWAKVDFESFSKATTPFFNWFIREVSLPIWGIILLALPTIILLLLYVRRNKKKPVISAFRNPILDTKIGNYSFEQMYGILAKEKLRLQTLDMEKNHMAPPEDTLLKQYLDQYENFKKGVSSGEFTALRQMGLFMRNDGNYVPELLCPKLTEYGLLKSTKHNVYALGKQYPVITYRVSDDGFKFYDCVQEMQPQYDPVIFRGDKI